METVDVAGGLLDTVQDHTAEIERIATARNDQHLVRELKETAARRPGTCTIAMAADRSRGKSTTLNGLLGRQGLLPTEVDVTTNVHIAVGPPGPGWPPAEHARIHYVDGAREDVAIDALEQFASEAGNPNNEKGVQRVEVSIEHPLLAEGFRFLDTPGVGGLISAHGRKTLEAVTAADGLIMVLEGEKPMSKPEIEFIAELADRVSRVVFVHNRRGTGDVSEIVRSNRAALQKHAARLAGAPMVVLSARQAERSAAERAEDPEYADELLEESAISGLVDVLRDHVFEAVRRRHASAILVESESALNELAAPDEELIRAAAEAERTPERIDEVKQELRLLTSRPPGPRLERRVKTARTQAAQEFADGIDLLQHRTLQQIDHDWHPDLAATLPDRLQTTVDALWGQATNRLQALVTEAAAGISDDYALGDVAHKTRERPPSTMSTEVAQVVPAPAPATAHAQPVRSRSPFAGLGRLVSLGAEALMFFVGIPPGAVPFAIAGLMYQQERSKARLGAQAEARSYVESRLRSARTAFDSVFEHHADDQLDRMLHRLDVRYQARMESLEATVRRLEELQAKKADVEEARRRLAELETLRRRQAELAQSLGE
jgi:polyhydroxyalkanoate synthesis regulator phasin